MHQQRATVGIGKWDRGPREREGVAYLGEIIIWWYKCDSTEQVTLFKLLTLIVGAR